MFKELHTNLAGLVTTACPGCEAVEWRYSPTFRKNLGTFPADVEDGFHFMLRAHSPNADLTVYGRYAIKMEFGRMVVRPTRIEPTFPDPTTPVAVAVTKFLSETVPREVKGALTIPTGEECDSDVCCNIVGTDGLTPGMRGMKNALVEKLLAKGYSAADADARATALIEGTLYYRGDFGVCWLEPDVRRINVRPDELEFVTTNETDPDDDRMIVLYDLMRGLDGNCSNTPVGPVNAIRLPMFTSQQ